MGTKETCYGGKGSSEEGGAGDHDTGQAGKQDMKPQSCKPKKNRHLEGVLISLEHGGTELRVRPRATDAYIFPRVSP